MNQTKLKILGHHRNKIHEGVEKLAEGGFDYGGALGNYRWTQDLLMSTWYQANKGKPPKSMEYKTGLSGGGFDKIHFKIDSELEYGTANADLSISLNKKSSGEKISIPLPVYGGGMSYGSVSLQVMLSRAMAAKELGTFTSTGEGGYPDELSEYKDNIITQVATGLFGVKEETIQRAKIVEIKYAQGAKPGLGGHLLGDKVTSNVAKMRESVPWVSLYSPFPFHSVYSVEDHKKHVDWLRTVNKKALISVKVSTPIDVDMVAVGSYYAGANIIQIDGSYGGTGAAPEIAKKNIAMPIEYAIPKVHKFLESEGVREEITIMASGGIRTAWDVAKAIALGADGCVIGTSELVALGCTHCGNCESGRGCPIGLTSTDEELSFLVDPSWGYKKIVNMYRSWEIQWKAILDYFSMKSITELRGRTDLMYHEDYGG
ncbi:MAG: alpha-hydroxy-acid oxidizing protein [Candidatus Aenigmarchaeota archaeon]|nr:alpha-hydroxy-acid oxidizing protein [Candidatus Aenigmarchaeota archaeon]